ncbi:hypothetical protein SAY87_025212 [Trapa incisa]|uniref:Uncharacterized protein n=1 Tax=Trapa incisa TaxID=236973 RepID=A0AAN7JFL8_9MYRT|nr:hypothetical protein SAY87_025212 [Trapa incisa]
MGRAPCCEKVGLKRGRWTEEEDEILTKYILANGEGSWRSLPKNAGLLRCGKSCRLRWVNYLRTDVKRGNISSEEESIIINLHATLGNRWSVIASKLPGRTDNEIKNYWNSHLRRRVDSVRKVAVVDAALLALIESVKAEVPSEKKEGRIGRRGKGKDDRTITVSNKGVGISTGNESTSDSQSRSRVSNSSSLDVGKVIAMQSSSMSTDNDHSTTTANGESKNNNNGGSSNECINDSCMACPGGSVKGTEDIGPLEGIDEEMLGAFNEFMDSSALLLVDGAVNEGDDCNLVNFYNAPLSPGNYISSSSTGLEEAHYLGGLSCLSANSPSQVEIGAMSKWHLESGVNVGCGEGEQMFSWLWEDDNDMEHCERETLGGVMDTEKGDQMVSWLLSED